MKEVHKLFSIEDIERIMDETREGVEKQKVFTGYSFSPNYRLLTNCAVFQEIDDILAGALTAEDEEAVDQELEEIIKLSLPDVPPAAEELEKPVPDLELPSVPSEEPAAELPRKEKVKKEAIPMAA